MKGIVSMARGDDPASADTVVLHRDRPARAELDGVYTVFGRVVDGIDAVDRIEATPVDGETPLQRVDLTRVRLEQAGQP